MRVLLSPLVKKQLKKLPKIIQFSVAKKIRDLASGVETTDVKSLVKYKDIYRIRVGDYRMVYRKKLSDYFIILIEHRKSVYQSLRRIW